MSQSTWPGRFPGSPEICLSGLQTEPPYSDPGGSPTQSACAPRAVFLGRYASENYSLAVLRIVLQGVRQSVWFASIAEALSLINLTQALSDEELARARSFRIPQDRDRFLAGRALLRYVLTQRTGGSIPISSWRFREGSHGKPILDAGLPALEFNLSHSEMCVAVGVGESHPLGVDLESIAPGDCHEIIPDVLTEQELSHLQLYDRDRQGIEFARIWTVKEACAKALGLGASIDFRGLEVELNPGEPRVRNLFKPTQEFAVAMNVIRCAGGTYILSLVTTRAIE
jgi:4'-phosphopantetheinyl transferase